MPATAEHQPRLQGRQPDGRAARAETTWRSNIESVDLMPGFCESREQAEGA